MNERGGESRSRVRDALIEGVASNEGARQSERLLLTMRQVADRLAIGRSTVYELVARGDLEVVHAGRGARVPVGALKTLIQSRRKSASASPPYGRSVVYDGDSSKPGAHAPAADGLPTR